MSYFLKIAVLSPILSPKGLSTTALENRHEILISYAHFLNIVYLVNGYILFTKKNLTLRFAPFEPQIHFFNEQSHISK